jgi:hypothetical protein
LGSNGPAHPKHDGCGLRSIKGSFLENEQTMTKEVDEDAIPMGWKIFWFVGLATIVILGMVSMYFVLIGKI